MSGGDAVRLAIEQAEERHRTGGTVWPLTGLPSVDSAFAAAGPGTLTLLAGLQGSGKTALMGSIAKGIGMRVRDDGIAAGLTPEEAERLPGVAIFSLEASAEEIGLRLAAHEADVDGADLVSGKLDMIDSTRLITAIRRTRNMAVRIHECAATPFRLLQPKIIMHLQRQPESVVFIDHLLVMGDDEDSRGRPASAGLNASSVASLTKNLKRLAKRLNVPIVVLTHVPRPAKDYVVRRPTKWDVKWAGEGDADNIVFVHRPIMVMSDTPPAQGRMSDTTYRGLNGTLDTWHKERESMAEVCELVVAKIRAGKETYYRMRWKGRTTSLEEWDRHLAALPVQEEVPAWV